MFIGEDEVPNDALEVYSMFENAQKEVRSPRSFGVESWDHKLSHIQYTAETEVEVYVLRTEELRKTSKSYLEERGRNGLEENMRFRICRALKWRERFLRHYLALTADAPASDGATLDNLAELKAAIRLQAAWLRIQLRRRSEESTGQEVDERHSRRDTPWRLFKQRGRHGGTSKPDEQLEQRVDRLQSKMESQMQELLKQQERVLIALGQRETARRSLLNLRA